MSDEKVVQMPRRKRPPAEGPTDTEVTERFVADQVVRWRYVPAWGVWMLFTGTVWVEDELKGYVHDAIEHLKEEASVLNGKAKARMLSATKPMAIARLSGFYPELAAAVDDWDRGGGINGEGRMIDMEGKTMQVRGRPVIAGDYVTKTMICTPDDGDCPLWMQFLEDVTDGDTDMMEFLQRMVGYCCTGHTREQKLFFIYGPGGNGKSVFVNIITRILNTYAVTADMSLLTASNQERHPTDLARLRGARLVTIQENDEGRRLDEAKVKQLTGGDMIAARFMNKDFFEFRPVCKILISGNHKPRLSNVDDAIKRRFVIIPFTVRFEEDRRDPALEEKLWAEREQIAAWMVKGARWWAQEGLMIPARAMAETAEYFEAEDTTELWLEECSRAKPEGWASNKDLFQSWSEWCKRSGEYAGTRKQFAQRLKKRSDMKALKRVVWGFTGRELLSEPLQDARMF